MISQEPTYEQLVTRVSELTAKLQESSEIIDSIRRGEVDAFIVQNNGKNEIYTLRSADKAYRLFIEKMNQGAVTIGANGVVLYANSSFASLADFPLEQVLGQLFINLVPQSHRRQVIQLIDAAWQNQESRGEISLPGTGGGAVPVSLYLNQLELDGGTALSIIATDMSLQREAQEQKREMEKKDEFITIASHELKTPVTSIKGYIQLLQFGFQQEGNMHAATLLGKVDAQINKLTVLISELLDTRKIENGQLPFHFDHFDLCLLLDEIVEETGRVLKQRLVVEERRPGLILYGDRNKIGQVITNFIDNAGKYSARDTEIIVRIREADGILALSVKDFGIGIPKEQQTKIFDRFFRVTGKKENTYSGLGLGLYISAEIIRRHQGKIGVESEEGKGSEFYFELPVHPAEIKSASA
ncbi:MAG TPA: HAMP domain-containing sensor histidine kinase [Puia sp.]|nr:HAMP domain-containing sensor histidine kinase [Puia sp.]